MQTVLDVSASTARILIFASLTLTMSIASASSGQLISRTGRYKIIAITGLTFVTAGMLSLAQLHTSSTSITLVELLVLTGLGLGLVMPVFTLSIQNAAPPNMIRAATALSQFCRSIGATIGAAVLGAILQMRYWDTLKQSIAAMNVPPAVNASLSNPARMGEIKVLLASNYGQSASGQAAAQELLSHIKDALVVALHEVFMVGAVMSIIALLVTFFVTERKLRSR